MIEKYIKFTDKCPYCLSTNKFTVKDKYFLCYSDYCDYRFSYNFPDEFIYFWFKDLYFQIKFADNNTATVTIFMEDEIFLKYNDLSWIKNDYPYGIEKVLDDLIFY